MNQPLLHRWVLAALEAHGPGHQYSIASQVFGYHSQENLEDVQRALTDLVRLGAVTVSGLTYTRKEA